MKAFEVYVNGEKACTAGVSNGIMALIINHIPRRGFELRIGGLEVEHVNWDGPAIGVGDEIVVRIVDTGAVDPPTRRTPRQETDG